MNSRLTVIISALALLGLSAAAQADVFNLGAGYTNLETVRVGDPGNVGEVSGKSAGGYGSDRVCGAVSYSYSIGKYEVTAKQYTDFLNKVAGHDDYGLWSMYMDTANSPYGCNIKRSGTYGSYVYSVADDWANRPVNYVNFWSACRFANWLHNGQPTGRQNASTTERGAYTLDGQTDRTGWTIQRSANWQWAVTSEDEWYKAAYYKGGGTDTGYWDYATRSDTILPGSMNCNHYPEPSPYHRTNVGQFTNSPSAYGTFDQSGNVWEWNETVTEYSVYGMYSFRDIRGGSFSSPSSEIQAAWRGYSDYPDYERLYLGFRVVSVPEPSSIITLAAGLVSRLGFRRRRR